MTPRSRKKDPRPQSSGTEEAAHAFRFFDNREKYLMFVTTCSEKWAVAERVLKPNTSGAN